MTEWIKLDDEKPPRGEYVLIWVPGRPWLSQSDTVFAKVARWEIDADIWHEFGPHTFETRDITHWARISIPS